MRKTTFLIDSYIRPDEAFHFARKSLSKRFPDAAHDHDFYEVFLIESGQTSHWVNGDTQQLKPGHLTFVRPQDVHAFSADRANGCQIINVMFRVETAQHLTSRYADTIASAFFDSRARLPETHMLDAARFARAVHIARQLQTAPRTLARIEEFLLVLTNRVVDITGGDLQNAPRWFAEACSAAQSRSVFSKGAAGLIAVAGRSHEHVCRTCKTYTGMTPSEYINQVRIEHAAHLLRSDERAIEDVVADCGFDNSSYFYRLFRRQYGTTPRRYRLENQRDPFQLSDQVPRGGGARS
ncbi:helix-turn-helix domain-containing protein [Yoonia sp. 208BN28-4]|uniref:helix-turn-helix domain-containing protein n=1 Tax=Yoonia sp. 208BN28-4 TaxID=3126505 RepID=UPI0030A90547